MPLQDALQTGAMALFGEKYDDLVRVVSMGNSTELCGGTHCRDGQIGMYITVQETSVAAGIRRIEALTGRAAEAYLRRRSALVDSLSAKLQTQPESLEAESSNLPRIWRRLVACSRNTSARRLCARPGICSQRQGSGRYAGRRYHRRCSGRQGAA